MNLADIVTQIQQDYPEDEIGHLLEMKLALIPKETYVREGYTNPKDWYRDCGNGEQDDAVIWDLVTYWETKYNRGKELEEKEEAELHDLLLEAYGVLT